jgi:hypothetical protein
MRRSPFLLTAGILAFFRVFVLGIAAVSLGMGDYGGVSSAMLRIFQLYNLLFVYIVILQYFKPGAREFLETPSLLVACASPVLSVLALLAFVHPSNASVPVDLARTGGSILILILLDVLILGLLALDALRYHPPREGKPALGQEAGSEKPQVSEHAHDDPEHEVS